MNERLEGDVVSRPTKYEELLVKTSRTFAAAIPLLEPPLREQVTVAYLLFRIADTFEDAHARPRAERIAALEDFARLLEGRRTDAEALARSWVEQAPSDNPGYLELLADSDEVLAELGRFGAAAQASIREHTARTARGMKEFVDRSASAGGLQLRDLGELERYCYVVAGIVGEMLTELFLIAAPALLEVASELRPRASRFGEALQLVNILKDAAADQEEGRSFLPQAVDRAEVFARARADLEVAGEYVRWVQQGGGSRGIVAFTALPVRLAWATLREVEARGPGAKVARDEVMAILAEVRAAVDASRSPIP